MSYYATIRYFNESGHPITKYHSFAAAEDRDEFIAADGYDADHAHRKIVNGHVSPHMIFSPLAELSMPKYRRSVSGCDVVYGADHRVN